MSVLGFTVCRFHSRFLLIIPIFLQFGWTISPMVYLALISCLATGTTITNAPLERVPTNWFILRVTQPPTNVQATPRPMLPFRATHLRSSHVPQPARTVSLIQKLSHSIIQTY